MNRTHLSSLFSLILIFTVSTACLTLFPRSPESTPERKKPERGPLIFNPPALPNASVGVPYEAQIEVTGNVTPVGDFIVDANTLPPGLALIIDEDLQDIAKISGVPEKAGTYTFRVDVWCYGTMVNGQMSSKEFTIVVE